MQNNVFCNAMKCVIPSLLTHCIYFDCFYHGSAGTLTTAKITIHAESVWHSGKFSKEDVALYAALSSNRDKKEDPIDRSVINHYDKLCGPEGLKECAKFTKIRGVGFNPIYKRVVFEFFHPTLGPTLT